MIKGLPNRLLKNLKQIQYVMLNWFQHLVKSMGYKTLNQVQTELKPLRNTECGLLNENSEFRTPHSTIGGSCMMKSSISGLKYSAFRNPNSAFQRGFTLIEIIVVIVILSIVSAISIKFVADSLRIYTMTVNQKTLFDEGKLALERMCRDIRDAQSITSVTAGPPGSITFTRTHLTATDNSNDSITFGQDTVPNPDTLVKTNNSTGTSGILAGNINSFTVANATNEIQLQLTLQLATGENVTLQTKVYPKNLAKDATYKNFCQNWMEAYQ